MSDSDSRGMSLEDLKNILLSTAESLEEEEGGRSLDEDVDIMKDALFVFGKSSIEKLGDLLSDAIEVADTIYTEQIEEFGFDRDEHAQIRIFNAVCAFLWACAAHRTAYDNGDEGSLNMGWGLGCALLNNIMHHCGYGLDQDGEKEHRTNH